MKKLFLFALAGLMVVGSAFALPSPEDRKALCEKRPDKYVWVAKTEACVPINPCLSNNDEIRKAYCIGFALPREQDKREMIIRRYAEKVLGVRVDNIKELNTCPDQEVGVSCSKAVGIYMSDGMYMVGEYYLEVSLLSQVDDMAGANACTLACDSYGYTGYLSGEGRYIVEVNEAECTDIADFASLLYEEVIEHRYEVDTGECILDYPYRGLPRF